MVAANHPMVHYLIEENIYQPMINFEMESILFFFNFDLSGTLRLSRENTIICTVDNPHIENKSNSILKRQTSILTHKDSFDIQVNKIQSQNIILIHLSLSLNLF